MFGKLVVQASQEYRKKQVLLDSEKRAPRRIIYLVIFFQAIEFGLILYLVHLHQDFRPLWDGLVGWISSFF